MYRPAKRLAATPPGSKLLVPSKILRLKVSHFRGIPGDLVLDLAVSESPRSMVILGDNGTGKSSIVDALEFGLQGHLAQSTFLSAERLPSLPSFETTELPIISVVLADRTEVERRIIRDESGLLVNTVEPHPSFAISPFVLRRSDILRFLDAPDAERTLVFSNYLRDSRGRGWAEHPDEELNRLRDERLQARIQRDNKITELAKLLGLPATDVPVDRLHFREFIKSKIYGGFSKEELKKKGIKVKVNGRAEKLATEVIEASVRQRELKNQISRFSVTNETRDFPRHLLPAMQEFLENVSGRLTHIFRSITRLEYLEAVNVRYGDIGQLALMVRLKLQNGRVCTPRQILSEANLDLLALLFFVAVSQESAARGQERVLVLDDVLQSIDSTIRLSFVEYLLTEMPEWQFVFTVHDRLWHRQLRELMARKGHPHLDRNIIRWSFAGGPQIRESSGDATAPVTAALDRGTAASICAEAGLLLEYISDNVSIGMETSITRRRGDRYTLGDLWPGVSKVLRKTSARGVTDEVDKWVHLRNLAGGHYNEWAESLARGEAEGFGRAVLALLPLVKCPECQMWIEVAGKDRWACRCGRTVLEKGASA